MFKYIGKIRCILFRHILCNNVFSRTMFGDMVDCHHKEVYQLDRVGVEVDMTYGVWL